MCQRRTGAPCCAWRRPARAFCRDPGATGGPEPEFRGQLELSANGLLDGRPWTDSTPIVKQALQFKQYQRVGGVLTLPPRVQLKQVFVRVVDERGALRASQTQRL